MGSYYSTYLVYFANPYVATNFYLLTGFSSLLTLAHVNRAFEKRVLVSRMYLLFNRTYVRIEKANSDAMDVPLDMLKVSKYDKSTGKMELEAIGQNLVMNLK